MKERAKRFLTSIVAALTLVGSVPTQAFASELEPDSSLISPQDTGNTPDVGSANAPAGESNTTATGGTTDGNTASNDTTVADTTTNVTPTTDTLTTNSTAVIDTKTTNSTTVNVTTTTDSTTTDTTTTDTTTTDTTTTDTTTTDTTTTDTTTTDTTTDDSADTEDDVLDEADLGENDLDEDDLGEDDLDDWDLEDMADALILSVEASAFTMRAAATQEINLLAEEDSSTEENQTTPVVKIGETTLGDAATDAGWSGSSGWRYNGSSVSMVNNGNPVDVHAEGTGVNFSMAGVNHIGTLYADGDVNITGTGILLIDEIDMLDGTKLNLLTNTDRYKDGSVAVFLLNKTSGEYELINGKGETNVVGILDEEYTIPDGVTLVVPDGGTLDMRVTTEVTTTTTVTVNDGTPTQQAPEHHYGFTQEDTDERYYRTEGVEQTKMNEDSEGQWTTVQTVTKKQASFFTPVLNIAQGAFLKLQEGAQLLMEAFKNTLVKNPQSSKLNVSGTLELEGEIKAYEDEDYGTKKNFILNVLSGGHVSGSGTMTDVVATYEQGAGNNDTLNLAGNSYVAVKSSGIASLNNSGTASVMYDDNVSIGNVSSSSGGSVTFYGIDVTNRLNITGNVTGNYTVDSGYVTIGGNFANETFKSFVVIEDRIPTFVPSSSGISGSIPSESGKPLPSFTAYVTDTNNSKMNNLMPGKFYTGEINYAAMKTGIGNYSIFEVYTYDATTEKVTLHLISEKNPTETIDKSKVFQIRGINYLLFPSSEAGSGIGSTNTSNTGSGILGGQNAGSLAGGNPNSVLGGNRVPSSNSGGSGGNTSSGNTGSSTGGSGTGGGSTGGGSTGGGSTGGSSTGSDNTGGGSAGSGSTGSGNTGSDNTGGSSTGSGSTGSGNTGSDNTGSGSTGGGSAGSGNTGSDNTGGSSTGSGNTGSGSTGSGSTGSGSTGSDNTGSGNTENSNTGSKASVANAGASQDTVVKTSTIGDAYQLSAYADGVELKQLEGGAISVTMEVTLEDGWNKNDLFVVFRGENGRLIAVKARYNPVTGMLMFDAPMLGKFQLVSFPWDGTDYESEAFLAALDDYMN